MCVIADGSGAIGLGGVMGGETTGSSEDTVDVFVESAWFDPLRTADTAKKTGIVSDAQYRFARGVDPEFVVPGLELATRLILEFCGGEPSEIVVLAGEIPARKPAVQFDPDYVHRLSGLSIGREGSLEILRKLGFEISGGDHGHGHPALLAPRRRGQGRPGRGSGADRGLRRPAADPLPHLAGRVSGVLNPLQVRVRAARRALAAYGWKEALTWSFLPRDTAELFGGGARPWCWTTRSRPTWTACGPRVLPNLIEAAARNAARGFADAALFEIGPIYLGDGPKRSAHQHRRRGRAASAAPLGRRERRRPVPAQVGPVRLLEDLGAPLAAMQIVQGSTSPWWHPGRSARLQLGPKTVLAEFGELHPAIPQGLRMRTAQCWASN
jgi:phenylalanyl-tRNA synthetase beta chain